MTRENKVKLFEACARLHKFEEDMHHLGFDMHETFFSIGKEKLFDVCEDIIIDEFGLDRRSKEIDFLIDRMIDTFTSTLCLCEDTYDRIVEIVEVEILSK